jgi:hypothetical protein
VLNEPIVDDEAEELAQAEHINGAEGGSLGIADRCQKIEHPAEECPESED